MLSQTRLSSLNRLRLDHYQARAANGGREYWRRVYNCTAFFLVRASERGPGFVSCRVFLQTIYIPQNTYSAALPAKRALHYRALSARSARRALHDSRLSFEKEPYNIGLFLQRAVYCRGFPSRRALHDISLFWSRKPFFWSRKPFFFSRKPCIVYASSCT